MRRIEFSFCGIVIGNTLGRITPHEPGQHRMIDVKQQRQEPDQLLLGRAQFTQNPFQANSMKLEKAIPDGAQILTADPIRKRNLSTGLSIHAGRLS